jgi:hypothetical protein
VEEQETLHLRSVFNSREYCNLGFLEMIKLASEHEAEFYAMQDVLIERKEEASHMSGEHKVAVLTLLETAIA